MYLLHSMSYIPKTIIKCGLFLLLSAAAVSLISCGNGSSGNKQTAAAPSYIVWKGESNTPPVHPEVYWAYYDTTVCKAYLYDGTSWVVIAKDGTSVSWRGSFSSAGDPALATPSLNWAYFNTTEKVSYIWDGSAWQIFARSGIDGVSMSWRGELDAAPSNPQLLWAYYNRTDKKSYIWNGSTWDTLAEGGSMGSSGNPISWRGSFASAPSSPLLNWAYYNTTDNCSYIYDGTMWTILAKGTGAAQQSSAPFTAYATVQGGLSNNPAFCVLTGRNLDKANTVYLQKAGASTKLIANKITYQSTNEIDCVFPITGTETGFYDVHVSDGSAECVIANGFIINKCEYKVNIKLTSRYFSTYYSYTKPVVKPCTDGSFLVAYTTYAGALYGIKVIRVSSTGTVTDLNFTLTNSSQFFWLMSPDSGNNPVIALTSGISSPALYIYRYNGTWTNTKLETLINDDRMAMTTLPDTTVLLTYKSTTGKSAFYQLNLANTWVKLGEFDITNPTNFVNESYSLLTSDKGVWFVSPESVASVNVSGKTVTEIYTATGGIEDPGIASDGYLFFSYNKISTYNTVTTLMKTDSSGSVALSLDIDYPHFTEGYYIDAGYFLDPRGILYKNDSGVLRPSYAIWNNGSYKDYTNGFAYQYLGLTSSGNMRFLQTIGDQNEFNIIDISR